MNRFVVVNVRQTTGNFHHYTPNLSFRGTPIDFSHHPKTFIVIIQIQFTQLHIDERIRQISKLSTAQDSDKVLVVPITEFCQGAYLISNGYSFTVRQTEELSCEDLGLAPLDRKVYYPGNPRKLSLMWM